MDSTTNKPPNGIHVRAVSGLQGYFRKPANYSEQRNSGHALAAASLLSFFSGPAIFIFPFGLFAIAIAESSGMSKQQVAAMIGPVLLLTIPFAPVMGYVIQRFHTPTLTVMAMVGAAASLLCLSLAPTTPVLFAITLAIAFFLVQFASPGVTGALITQSFDGRRGLALGIASAFTGLGVSFVPVADAWMISHWGWRQAYAVGGGVIFLAAIVNFFLLRGVSSSRPSSSVLPAGQSMKTVLKESLAYVRKQPVFWLTAWFSFLLVVVANSMPLHMPLIMEERGASPGIQAASLTATGVAMVIGRPVVGWVLDTIHIRWVLAFMMIGPLAGTLGLLFSTSDVAALISASGFGLALGGEIVVLTYIISRAFPEERFGSIFGWFMLILAFSGGLGPIAISTLVSLSGSYHAALIMMAVISALAFVTCFFFKDLRVRPTEPALAQQGI